ncbi:MAG: aminotransferase class I/II-fold pyridoxal phosphate-dependent enzyme [Alphaproteobacteria bacterium]|nr:aminotransferase class I/II-fold pyridoxal phosphate-dependent enzyme [Alphaproteobacteria bacterium]
MLNPRLENLPDSPFRRLDALLASIPAPPDKTPILLSVGEPQHDYPELVAKALAANAHLYNKYPPIPGTPELRRAAIDWLARRYRLSPDALDPERHIAILSGTREGLYLLALTVVPQEKKGGPPLVLMPNPFYQVYAGAAVTAGAEARYVPARRENNFLPDFAGLGEATLARTALVYVCTPANPQGTVADLDYLTTMVTLARRHDFVLVVDECYAEIYDKVPPPGVFDACRELGGGFDNVIAIHSLSKRSSVPGLRSGLAVGDAKVIAPFIKLRTYALAGMPLPIAAASTALWREESHVEANRALYRRKLDIAERILSNRFAFFRPPGGFFLWLEVGDGLAATKKLWAEAALKVVPGEYLAREVPGEANPGKSFIRVALVDSPEVTEEGLRRLVEVLG